MRKTHELTADVLRDVLHYDPETGVFTWRAGRRRVPAGQQAGSVNHNGYIRIRVLGGQYLAHRLAWLYMTGEWPPEEIDHKDRQRSNNVWSNLRASDHSGNMKNRAALFRINGRFAISQVEAG